MEQGFAQKPYHSVSSEAALAERWMSLKPTILNLYIDQDLPLSKVAEIIRRDYGFHAYEHSYKYYLSQWEVSKNITGKIKDEIITALGKRSKRYNSSSVVSYNAQKVNKNKLRRHITTKETKKEKADSEIRLSNNAFLVWNLPYRALRSSSTTIDHYSPFPQTPAYLVIAPDTQAKSSPNNAPTPTTLALRSIALNDRARLFVQAKHADLMKHLERPEKKILTTYLYQFWLFAFKTAKNWGYGPQDWTVELLDFERYRDKDNSLYASPNTPRATVGTPRDIPTPGSGFNLSSLNNHPPALCNWTIHAAIRNSYEGDDEDDSDLDEQYDSDGGTMPRWPAGKRKQSFEERLQAALEKNSFTTLKPGDLPIALGQITRATRRSRKELLQESFGFSLVARNEEVFWRLLPRASEVDFRGTGIYPFHLLTSYLDGSKTCCNLLDAALNSIAAHLDDDCIDSLYVDNHGHTVLDNLMITILKGHTSCQPGDVDDKWGKMKRFAGEEVDICGRWDADSSCIRELFASGRCAIPIEWKHMFCHTSAQAICHCIGRLFGPLFAPDINTPSGLFKKFCQCCGMSLVLLPLHSLVLTAFHLARSGCNQENLFGMLAVLVCLLANGADPHMKANISLEALMNRDSATNCSHEALDPFELSERVPTSLMSEWTESATLGWQVFCAMLRYARNERRLNISPRSRKPQEHDDFRLYIDFNNDGDVDMTDDISSYEDSDSESNVDEELCPHVKYHNNFYGGSKVIGILWAAIQTELLTYRRLSEDDPWMSKNFDICAVLDGLNSGGLIYMPLINDDMMSPYCHCGRFLDVTDEASACVDEVCTHYFANVDVWSRARYIMIPEHHNECWY